MTSHSLAKLSDGAERLFWRLTVVADDAGRFDAYGATVKAKCFPVVVDNLSTAKVGRWLAELSQDHVIFYEVEGRQYGQFRKWAEYQRSYGLKSKFPEPPADCGEVRDIPALIRDPRIENRESRIEIRESVKPTRRDTWLKWTLTDPLRGWLRQEGVPDAQHVILFEECRSYWLDQPEAKMRSDCDRTFQKHILKLKGQGMFKFQGGVAL